MSATKSDTKAFEACVNDLLTAIDRCFKECQIVPALMLIYSTIDIMAALDRPASPTPPGGAKSPSRTTGIGAQFKSWVAEFLKPTAKVKASPAEVWAWRNGLVHSYSFESDDTKAGRVRRAFYCYGTAKLAILRRTSDVKAGNVIPVKIEHLIAALKTAIELFKTVLAKDPARGSRVYSRASQQFYALVRV